jgi:RimJ/RimL family protein N-acetyltransferase
MKKMDLESENCIFSKKECKILVSNQIGNDGLLLLKNTTYGTSGPKYTHTNQVERTENLSNSYFFKLYFNNKLIGLYCLCKRFVQNKNAYYGRYFTILPEFQSHGYGLILKDEAVKYIESIDNSKPNIYSYIEENNKKSLQVSQKLGFVISGRLETIIFTRFYPKSSANFSKASELELKEIHAVLKEKYYKYHFNNLEKIGYLDNYFILKKNGNIVAGIQANPVTWIIDGMEGITGFFLLNILPKIPILNKVFNPSKFEFLAIEGIFGSIEAIFELLEATLNHFSIYSAMLQLDVNDPYLIGFKNKGKLGLLNFLKKPTKTLLITKYPINQSPNEPNYVSSFDYT